MKILIPITMLILALPLHSEISSNTPSENIQESPELAEAPELPASIDQIAQTQPEVASANRATEISPIDSPAALEQADQVDSDQPKHVGKASKYVNKRERSRHVLDVVLAGIVTVGTFIAILLL